LHLLEAESHRQRVSVTELPSFRHTSLPPINVDIPHFETFQRSKETPHLKAQPHKHYDCSDSFSSHRPFLYEIYCLIGLFQTLKTFKICLVIFWALAGHLRSASVYEVKTVLRRCR